MISQEDIVGLWREKPSDYGVVKVWDRKEKSHYDKTIFRKFKCYGKVPDFRPEVEKSYMYSPSSEMPLSVFMMLNEVKKEFGPEYNQVIINWYDEGDYIEPHRDCTNFLVEDTPIIVYYWSEEMTKVKFEAVNTKVNPDHLYLKGTGRYFLNRRTNQNYRHSINSENGKYMSISFRAIK